MKDINHFIIEKLILSRNKINKSFDLDDPEFYQTCDIPELDKDIDDYIDKIQQARCRHILPKRQIKRKNGSIKNSNWYAFYCYVYYNGPTKKKDIIKAVKGDTNSQYAELFSELKKLNILSSSKWFLKAEDPKKWKFV